MRTKGGSKMTIEMFLQGFLKMWWIWIAILFGLVGTSITERRDKHARLKTKRINRRGKSL